MKCPLCEGIDIGKVGTRQFYCWQCLREFHSDRNNGYKVYYVDEEGVLVSVEELGMEDSRSSDNEVCAGHVGA